MRFEKLGDIAKIQIGKTPKRGESKYWGKGHSWVAISDLKDQVVNATKEEITDLAITECGCKKISKGTLLMSFKLSIGKLAFAGKDLFTNEAICAIEIINKVQVDSKYLFYALKNTKLLGSNVAVKGATLNTSSLNNLKVPIAGDLPTQQDIARVLSQAEELIGQRRESIALLDAYLKSVFLEMFGDPETNRHKFPIGKVGDVVAEVKYGTSKSSSEFGQYPYLRMNNITSDGYMDFSSIKYIDIDDREKGKYVVKRGDLLFNRTNSKELVGKTGVYNCTEEMVIAGYLIRVRTNEKSNPWYLWGYLNSLHGKKALRGMCKAIVGMANINAQELQNIAILVPPLKLQNRFAKIVEKTEALKSQYQESLRELEELYAGLSWRAFMGEME